MDVLSPHFGEGFSWDTTIKEQHHKDVFFWRYGEYLSSRCWAVASNEKKTERPLTDARRLRLQRAAPSNKANWLRTFLYRHSPAKEPNMCQLFFSAKFLYHSAGISNALYSTKKSRNQILGENIQQQVNAKHIYAELGQIFFNKIWNQNQQLKDIKSKSK